MFIDSVRLSRLLCLAVAIAMLPSGELSAAVVQFKPQVSVSNGVVTLGDIAVVLDADAAKVQELERIVISPAPAAGRQTRLELANIISRLRATGVNLAETEIRGANVVTVMTAGGSVTDGRFALSGAALEQQRTRVEKMLTEVIEASFTARHLSPEGISISVQFDEQSMPVLLPALSRREVEIIGGNPAMQGAQAITARIRDRRGTIQDVPVVCHISPLPRILAARYTIPPGHILRETDLVWREAELVEGVVTRLEEALNKETRRTIRQDELLRVNDIQAVPLVRPNDIVTVISRQGAVTIRREMKARSEGTLGESVTLASLRGREIVLATVTGLHEAEVIGGDAPQSTTLQDSTGRIEFRGDR